MFLNPLFLALLAAAGIPVVGGPALLEGPLEDRLGLVPVQLAHVDPYDVARSVHESRKRQSDPVRQHQTMVDAPRAPRDEDAVRAGTQVAEAFGIAL